MNAFLRARTALGFEHLISFRAELSDAERDITGIEELLFRGEKIVSKPKLAILLNTISQLFPKASRISGPEVGDGAKPDVPTTERQNETKQEIFKNFQATTCNESLQSPSPSPTGFNTQASVVKIVTSERRESP